MSAANPAAPTACRSSAYFSTAPAVRSAVVHSDEAPYPHLAGARVHADNADVGTERIRQIRRVVHRRGVQMALDSIGQIQRGVGSHRDLGDALGLLRIAAHLPLLAGPLQVLGRYLEHREGDDPGPLTHFARYHGGCCPGYRRRPGTVGPEAERGPVGIAVHDLDIIR